MSDVGILDMLVLLYDVLATLLGVELLDMLEDDMYVLLVDGDVVCVLDVFV